MSYCDDKNQAVGLIKEARAELETRLEDGIRGMIEYPVDSSPLLNQKLKEATKSVDKASLRKDIIREKKRFLEHSKLFNHLLNKSIEYLYAANPFVIPADFVDSRLDYIQGVFQQAYSQSAFAQRMKGVALSGLNNSDKWDDGKIRYILNKIKGWEKRADKEGKKLSSYENTIKKPLLTASALDPSGQARKLVKMTDELLDTYLQSGYSWKVSIIDPNTGVKSPISLQSIDARISGIGARGEVSDMTSEQKSIAAAQLSEELMHSEVRNIIPKDIPTNPRDFIAWRNSWSGKRFFEMMKFESERHDIGDSESRYVMIPLHSDKVGAKLLRKQRKSQFKEGSIAIDPGEKENAFLIYRIPDNLNEFFASIKKNSLITEESLKEHLLPSELEEGFFTAQEHKVYKYEYIPKTLTPKRKYANWTRGVKFHDNIYDPPDGWMPEMWESVDMQREWNELFFEKVLKKDHKEAIKEYELYRKQVTSQLMNQGWDVDAIEEALNKVNDIGGMQFNISEDKQGNFVSSNSYVRKASKWSYGHIKFEQPVYLAMIEEAWHVIKSSYLPEIEAQLTTDYSILESEESDAAERAESLERISEFENKKKYYEDMVANIEKRLYGDIDNDLDRKEMVMVDRILATKGRTLFTDHKKRRKDRGLWPEYVDQATRANELTRLKIQLLKTILGLQHNPQMVNFLVDQVKAAAGDADIESGFLNFNYSDKSVANLFGDNVTEETVRDVGLIYRGYKTGANLGSWTSLTNNTQRLTAIINYGYKPMMKGIRVMTMRKGDANFSYEELKEQVEETGVLHPGNAFIDMLTLGIDLGEGSDWKEFILPLTDTIRLWKATTLEGWMDQSKSWDKLISAARARSEGEAIQTKELKRVKEELYDIMHSKTEDNPRERKRLAKRIQDLKIGLTQSNINRLVKWKLQWFPLGSEYLTMSGSEETMRLEHSYMGLNEAFEMGLVRVPENRKWKYTDSDEAVNMSRLYVYMNLFGFTKVMASKMFRGAVGGTAFQWRQYDYNQVIVEHEWLRSAAMSPEFAQGSKALGWGALPFRITMQTMKKIIRGGVHSMRAFGMSPETAKYWTKMIRLNKEHDDKNLDRATNFFLTRGMASILSKVMYFNFAPYTIIRSIMPLFRAAFSRNKVNQRMLFGLESPLINRMLTMSMLVAMVADIGRRGLDDDDDIIEDFIRDWFPSEILTIFLWISDFSENAFRGARPYLPTPFKELAGTEEVYELIDDFTSF